MPAQPVIIFILYNKHLGYKCSSTDSSPVECSGTGSEQFSYEGQTSCSQCPAGYECPNTKSLPQLCSQGFYSLVGDGYCTICPAGYSCSKITASPVECSSGYFSLQGSTYCSICPLGYYCPSQAQYPIKCPSGMYSSQGSSQCSSCPKGKFCPSTKVPEPYSCPSGFYTNLENQVACQPCPAGYQCSDPTSNPVACDEGYFSFGSSSTCQQCPAGYYCPKNNKEPIICPAGKHSVAGQSECKDCTDGYSCLQSNAESQQICSSGQYRVNDGRTTVCRDCPPGSYCSSGSSQPQLCEDGTYTSSNQTTCTSCTAGNFCPSLADTAQTCPPGTYQPNPKKTFCYECPAGYYCPNATITDPIICPSGKYSPLGNQTACLSCPAGFYCPSTATIAPVQCASGYYSASESSKCTKCPAGSACPTPYVSDKYSCPTGTFSQEGSTYCFECPIGMQCSFIGGYTTVSSCPVGSYSNEGSATCTKCPAGKSCHTLDSQGILDCEDGFYSLEGEITCKPCPAGFMCPKKDGTQITACASGLFAPLASTKCYQCPSGHQCPFTHLAMIEQCPPGTYSLGNQSVCIECPEHYQCPHRDSIKELDDGYFSPKGTGVALRCRAGWMCKQEVDGDIIVEKVVKPCEIGYYSDTGASECTPCPIGFYCPNADSLPLKCPAGFYQDEEGQAQCVKCPTGQYSAVGNNTQCSETQDGQEYVFGGFNNQIQCIDGSYSNSSIVNDPTLVVCQHCDPGTLCSRGETDPVSATCPLGYWCNIQDASFPSIYSKHPCPTGYYPSGNTNSYTLEDACTPCPEGYYCEGANRDKHQCLPGYYCPAMTNRSTEYPCPSGTYQSQFGMVSEESCQTCPIRYYCPEGSGYPFKCQPGTICPTEGIREYQQVPCPAGQYNDELAQISCKTCPEGAYCPSGSAYPQFCPPGTYQDEQGKGSRTDCKTCPDNYLCTVFGLTYYQNVQQPGIENGYLSPAGTHYAQQLPCPPGTQDTNGKLTDPDECSICPQGFACDSGTSSLTPLTRKKQYCEPGYYCPSGTLHDKHYPCPGGTYSRAHDLVSQTQCLTCPAGYFCPPGSYQPYICPNGYYCQEGTENFQHSPCKNGTYSLKKGLKAATECDKCPKGYFCKEFNNIFPEICPRGTYNDVEGAYLADNSQVTNQNACKICDAGYKCPNEGMTQQIICPSGTYSSAGSIECFECQEGKDCSSTTGGLTMTQYRQALACPEGYYCIGSTKQICPAGYFCPSQTRSPQQCPVGTYLSSTGKKDVTECIPVPAGYYTDKRGSSSYSYNLCALGWYCPQSSNSQYAYQCPRGTYSNATGSTVCKQCPAGYYCDQNSIQPIICPQGHYCPAGTYSPLKCLSGTFGAALGYINSSQCQPCSPGQYCSQQGLSSPDGLCDPGYYCKGGAKVPNPTDGVTGDVCQKGGFCDIGSKRVKECPPGTYNNQTKGKTQSDCIACPPGYYCSGTNQPQPSGQCQAGYYCPSGSTVATQLPAPPGYYTKAGASEPTPCDYGQYNPFTAQSSCLPCKAGFYCDEQGIADQIKDCPRGQYCVANSSAGAKCPSGTFYNQFNAKSKDDCKQCLPGKYCATDGLIEPTGDCEQGFYCISGAIIPTPSVENTNKTYGPCPAGYYCPRATSYPIPCPAGTFSSASQAYSNLTCQSCTRGFYCAFAGQSVETGPCDAGFWCPLGMKTPRPELNYCLPGQYCPPQSGAPTTVPAGYYQNMAFQSTYIQCPKGYYCEEGSTTYVGKLCPAGYYCPAGTTYNASFPCAAGTYQPLQGQDKCVDCDPGSFCGSQNLSAVSGQCAAGYYCKSGSPIDTPTSTVNGKDVGGICQKGYYCPQGSAFMMPCKPGYYCNRVALSDPIGKCAAGYYCTIQATKEMPISSSDGGNICPPGYYCESGSSSPIPCPPGTYSPLSGNINADACMKCKAGFYCESSGLSSPSGVCQKGYYCPEGSKTPRHPDYICPAGYKCPTGSSNPIACDSYTYQDVRGSDSCKTCPAGFQCTSTSISLCGIHFYCPAGQARQACPEGKMNFKYNASSINECLSCMPGYYCAADNTNGIVITPCPAGVFCVSEAKDINGNGPCPQGNYCPAQTSVPKPCPPAKYCSSAGLSAPTGVCAAGYYCKENATTSMPLDGITGDICPRGYYCPEGSYTPIGCPIGTYNSQTGAISQDNCTVCPDGFLCNDRGAENFDSDCPAGYYCIADNQNIPCPAGFYCPARQKDPIKCPSGQYQPNIMQTSCLDCPEGFFCPQTPNATDAIQCKAGYYCEKNSVQDQPCPIGTYNPFEAQKSKADGCQDCPEGYYCDSPALTSPTGLCAAGYFCSRGANTSQPIDYANSGNFGICQPGYYCPSGSGDMVPCPIGTYNDQNGSQSVSACLPCPAGFYCDQIGQTLASYGINFGNHYCDGGIVCTGGAKSSYPSVNDGGQLCPAGYYCQEGQAIKCPIGTYQPNKAGEQCLICPKGKLCNETGLTEPYDCPAGFYCQEDQNGLFANQLLPCPKGTYSEFLGNQDSKNCTPCKEGQYCSGGGTEPDGPCASQYYCGKGSYLQVPSDTDYIMDGSVVQGTCPKGFYCPEGTVAPLPCPIGQFNPNTQRDQCYPCPENHYCDEFGLNNDTIKSKPCAPGYYCISGAIIPNPTDNTTGRICSPGHYCTGDQSETECPNGYYEPRYGSHQCQQCYKGYLCPQGSVEPTPCPIGYYCPTNASEAVLCPDGTYGHTTKLYSDDQCATCPAGKYCQFGVIQGNCPEGFYCDSGAASYYDYTKLCPQNHYCTAGTLYPKRCPEGGTTSQKGAKTVKECQDCAAGNFCLENGDSQYACPKGYYCLGNMDPVPCPKYKYNNMKGRQSSYDCLACPPGYFCNDTAISNYKNYPCPRGYYCPIELTKTPTICPAGTYNQIGAGASITDCLACPEGSYCPQGTILPQVCKNGTYCPINSKQTTTCEKGYYCPTESGSQQTCPAAFQCPISGTDIYQKCDNGTFCPSGTINQFDCPSGYYGSSNPSNINILKGCITCDAGYYSIDGQDCLPCTPGYVCLGNTTSDKPTNISTQGGYICPQGYYCPKQSSSPLACPRGTYGPQTGPANTYGDTIGLQKCKSCGGYTNSVKGSSSCTCIGSNRVYLAETQSCACKTGYIPVDSSSSQNSIADCTQKIYDKCADGQVQDYLGNCRDPKDCSKECNGGSGTISAGIGICQCDNQTSAEDICDTACQAKRKQITFTSNGKIQVYDPITKTTQTIDKLSDVEGSVQCSNEDTSQCQILSVSSKTNGDFGSDFKTPTAITNSLNNTSSKRLLLQQDRDDFMNEHFRYTRSRSLQASGSYISNPIICMSSGSALIFENINKNHYPVYQSDSLVNTNSDFDYSQFVSLGQKLQSGQIITQFIFSFQDSGIYMFADSSDSSKTTIITVMSDSQKCPSGLVYESKTQANLLKAGIAVTKDIIYTPDWGFFIGVVAAVLFLIMISVFVIGYVYRKSWVQKPYDKISYQDKHYSMIKLDDPEDHDALISINADSQAFQYLNEGKDIVRTRDQLKAKKNQEKADKERLKREKQQKHLDLEEVENLKDKLNKHVAEIKKLFGVSNIDDGDNEQLLEDNEELRAQKLLDQILKIKDIIDENRRVLEGDELEDHHQTEDDKRRLEQEQREKEERERREKEEEDQRLRDLEYQRLQQEMHKKTQEDLEDKKDEVLGHFEKDVEKRKQEMLEKMQKLGLNLSKEEQQKLMDQFDQNLGKIGSILEDDEQYQQDMLQRKLEERKNRRKKLQEKLQQQEKVLDQKGKEFDEKKELIEQEYQDQQQKLEQQIAREKIEKKRIIADDLEQMKKDKLQHFEDLLQESKNSKDFGKVLDQYQDASKKVDAELEKERKKQENDLEKALKSRRGQKKAQLEKEKADKLKALQKELEDNTEKERKQIEEIKNIIAMDEGTKPFGGLIEKNLEKIKANASQQTESQLKRRETLRDKSDSMLAKLKQGLLSKLERMLHQHQQERREMEKRMIEEGKKLDDEVDQAKTDFTQQLESDMASREELQRKLLNGELDENERRRLMEELKKREQEIQKKIEQQNDEQDNILKNKLKARRNKKQNLAEKEREMKSRQIQEREFEEDLQHMADKQAKSQQDREQLDQVITEMKLNLPQEELPFAIQRALDEKHEAELNDLLVQLFELKCRELQDEVFNLLEEKLHKQAVIKKEAKDKIEVIDKIAINRQYDPVLIEKLEQSKENIKKDEEQELQELEWQYKAKEAEMEREVSERLMDKENGRLLWLKEKQLQEKKEVFDQHLPDTNSLKDLIKEIHDQEEQELMEFKKEQESEKARKIADLERQKQLIQQEMLDQQERIAKMERLNQKLESEEQQRERERQRRKRNQERFNMNSNDYIEKLKKDLEKINEQLDSAISQEKARQLKMMQESLTAKMQEAERLRKEEEEKAFLAEVQEKQRQEEERKQQQEIDERINLVKAQIEGQRKIIDKRKYCGPTQPEKKNEYYVIMMRRKEKQQLLKMQQNQSGIKNNLAGNYNSIGAGMQSTLSLAAAKLIENAASNIFGENQVSKEQQLKLLNEILTKIENMELKVKQQLHQIRPKLPPKNKTSNPFKIHDEQSIISSQKRQSSMFKGAHGSGSGNISQSGSKLGSVRHSFQKP